MTEQHNIWLVLLAATVCVAGCWAIIRLYRRGLSATGAESIGWQFLAATAAGASIWATHFIAIIAYNPETPFSLDPVMTIMSLLVAMVGSFAGFLVASLFKRIWASILGGVIVGLSIAIMHYVGMSAYLVEGLIEWDQTLVIASVALPALVTPTSVVVASRIHDARNTMLAVGLLASAIVSLHFTGMAAFKVTSFMYYAGPSNSMAMQTMAMAIALVTLLIVGAVISSYLIDNQTRADTLNRLKQMALNDVLTGLANRAAYNMHIKTCIDLADRCGPKFALVAIDLDRFKEINDIRGHAAGDDALIALAGRMERFNDGTLFFARVGGDEFALTAPYHGQRALRELLASLHAELIRPFMVGEFEISVGASIGVCIYPDDAKDADELANNTDLALYRAKTESNDKICFFDTVMDAAVRQRRALAAELRHAIDNDELEVHYQFQGRVSDGSRTGYEALVRWNHPEHGNIPPMEFIPLAEENGLILKLGEWVLRRVCNECATLGLDIRFAVNLSPIQFLHPNLPGMVRDILAQTGMQAGNLELELTESAIIADKQRTLIQLAEIRKLGVTIALDDFGTGYSSLDTLRAFPFDKIKLDRTFMQGIETSDQSRSILRAVLALGRSLEIPVLAEGIETPEQLTILREEGCEEVQGYYLGRPAPLKTVLSALAEKNQSDELRQVIEQLRRGNAPGVTGKQDDASAAA